MYPIPENTKNMFLESGYQVCELVVNTTTREESLIITEEDLLQGGLTVDRYCLSGQHLEVGSAIAAELTVLLNNDTGKFDDVTFEGAEIFVKVAAGNRDAGISSYVPLGYFTVDEPPRKRSAITLKALDRMVQFDRKVSSIVLPTTLGALYELCCTECGVPMGTLYTELRQADYAVTEAPISLGEGSLTYRMLIQWIAEINGACAFIDWDGKLRMCWYQDTDTVIDAAVRHMTPAAELDEKAVKVTGVHMADTAGNEYTAGTTSYAISSTGNELISHDLETVVTGIYGVVNGFTYTPYSCAVLSMPHVWPMDRIVYKDNKGVNHSTIVTHVTFKLCGKTSLEAKGETSTVSGYAVANPFTGRETAILKKMKLDQSRKLAAQEAATLSLNQTISNAFGLYRTEEKQKDGSVKFYYHTGKTLADSNVIYTLNSGGFAWTDDWNDGNPVWNYGIDSSGNAVLRTLSAYKITADQIDTGAITAEKIAANAITTDKIAAGSITVDKLAAGALTANSILVKNAAGNTLLQAGSNKVSIGGWNVDENSLYSGTTFANSNAFLCRTGSQAYFKVAGQTVNGLVFRAGEKFGVTTVGRVYASDIVMPSGTLWLPYTDAELQAPQNGVHLSPDGLYIQMDDTDGGGTYINVDRILVAPKGTLDGNAVYGTEIFDSAIRIANGIDDSGVLLNGAIYATDRIEFLNPDVNDSAAHIHYGNYSDDYVGMKLLSETLILAAGSAINNNQTNKIVIGVDPTAGTGVRITGSKISVNKSITVDSDRNLKYDIESLEAKYENLLDLLRPVRFKYNGKNDGKFHTGFIAQEVQEAMQSVGIAAEEFGGHAVSAKGTQSLAYEEFIALIVYELQKLKKQIQK